MKIFIIYFWHQSRAKFIIKTTFFNYWNSLFYFWNIDIDIANIFVLFKWTFQIHCQIINQFWINQIFYNIRINSTGIQFDFESCFFYFFYKIFQVWLYCWFSTAYGNSINKIFSFVYIIKNNALIYKTIYIKQMLVMAIIARQRTSKRKHDWTNVVWIIYKRIFYKPCYFHLITNFFLVRYSSALALL